MDSSDQPGESSRFHDEETTTLLRGFDEASTANERLGKNGRVVVAPRISGDGSEDLSEASEISRPRRRRTWLARLLMPVRRRKPYRAIGDENEFGPIRNSQRKRHVSTRAGGICLGLIVLVLAIFGLIHIWNFVIGLSPFFWDDSDDLDYWLPNWGLPGQPGQDVAHYPTDATRDILPIPCHSHNDYWRRIPLYEAIHYGCTGVEADVWLFDNDNHEKELYVGHNTASLTPNRTFRSLYVDPIVELLNKQNAESDLSVHTTRHGVFDEDPLQSLTLLVDFKNNGRDIFPHVVNQLSALREKNYLTYFDGEKVVPGPVTVVGTGNTPFDLVKQNNTYREIFFDAPLDRMWEKPVSTVPSELDEASSTGQGLVGVTNYDDFDTSNSYYASVNFGSTIGILWRGKITDSQLEKIRGQIQGAHARGLKVRYWNAPSWPLSVRNHVWHVLWREGADMLNVDDLRGAARRDWRGREQRLKDS